MANLAGFIEALGDIPAITEPALVKRKSRDMTAAFSPVMKREMADKFADAIVTPRNKQDVLRIASAAARNRMPLIARGGGHRQFRPGGFRCRAAPSSTRPL
jgi:FAD/FMN-containing dehydrogenase